MKDGKALARELEYFVNGCSDDDLNEFVNGFMHMHNTLQQKTFGLFLRAIVAMADVKHVDARNEASKKRAQQIVQGLKTEIVKELKEENPEYWSDSKAREWVFGNFDITRLPLI